MIDRRDYVAFSAGLWNLVRVMDYGMNRGLSLIEDEELDVQEEIARREDVQRSNESALLRMNLEKLMENIADEVVDLTSTWKDGFSLASTDLVDAGVERRLNHLLKKVLGLSGMNVKQLLHEQFNWGVGVLIPMAKDASSKDAGSKDASSGDLKVVFKSSSAFLKIWKAGYWLDYRYDGDVDFAIPHDFTRLDKYGLVLKDMDKAKIAEVVGGGVGGVGKGVLYMRVSPHGPPKLFLTKKSDRGENPEGSKGSNNQEEEEIKPKSWGRILAMPSLVLPWVYNGELHSPVENFIPGRTLLSGIQYKTGWVLNNSKAVTTIKGDISKDIEAAINSGMSSTIHLQDEGTEVNVSKIEEPGLTDLTKDAGFRLVQIITAEPSLSEASGYTKIALSLASFFRTAYESWLEEAYGYLLLLMAVEGLDGTGTKLTINLVTTVEVERAKEEEARDVDKVLNLLKNIPPEDRNPDFVKHLIESIVPLKEGMEPVVSPTEKERIQEIGILQKMVQDASVQLQSYEKQMNALVQENAGLKYQAQVDVAQIKALSDKNSMETAVQERILRGREERVFQGQIKGIEFNQRQQELDLKERELGIKELKS